MSTKKFKRILREGTPLKNPHYIFSEGGVSIHAYDTDGFFPYPSEGMVNVEPTSVPESVQSRWGVDPLAERRILVINRESEQRDYGYIVPAISKDSSFLELLYYIEECLEKEKRNVKGFVDSIKGVICVLESSSKTPSDSDFIYESDRFIK